MAMIDPKFMIPEARVALVDRPRLFVSMADFGTRKCTLLHAPPGGGKSTFLSQWIRNPEVGEYEIFWVNLDEGDADPSQLLSTLASAGQVELSGSDCSSVSTNVRSASNKLWSVFQKKHSRAVIVLEDYHVAENEELNAVVGALLERAPPGLHMVITSARLPAIPLGRLRAQGQVVVIGPTELAFDAFESRALLTPAIPEKKIDALASELAGWPAFMQLVAINAATEVTSTGLSDFVEKAWQDIANFVETELFEPLAHDKRQLLIETAAARIVSLDLCVAISGEPISSEKFRELARSVPTIAVGASSGAAFRHHPIISRYLRNRLAELGSAKWANCHNRAAEYFLRQGDVVEAAFHMSELGDIESLSNLIEKRGAVRIALVNGFPELVALIEYLPAEAIMKRPRLRLAQAWVSAKMGNVVAARQWSQSVHSAAAALPIDDTIKRETLFVEKMMWAVFEEHSIGADALREIEDIRTIVPDDDPWFASWVNNLLCVMYTRSGNLMAADEAAGRALNSYRMADALYGEVFMRGHQAMISVMSGRFSDAAAQAELAAETTNAHFAADIGLSAMIDFLRGHIAFERNELVRAKELLAPALQRIGQAETWVELHALGAASLAKILFEAGAHDEANACLDTLHRVGEQRGLLRLQWLAAHCRFSLLLANGQKDEAANWAGENDIFLAAAPPFVTWFERERASLASMHIELVGAGELECLQERLEDFVDEAQSLGHKRATVEALILLTRLFHSSQRHEDARVSLERALAIAVPEAMVRAFLEYGAPLIPIMKNMIRAIGIKSISPATLSFVIRIVSEAGGIPIGDVGASSMFSEKELDVLSNLVADHSNKMIARRLSISEATVKFHLANIYRKLGVNTRADAKSIARERHLVSLGAQARA